MSERETAFEFRWSELTFLIALIAPLCWLVSCMQRGSSSSSAMLIILIQPSCCDKVDRFRANADWFVFTSNQKGERIRNRRVVEIGAE